MEMSNRNSREWIIYNSFHCKCSTCLDFQYHHVYTHGHTMLPQKYILQITFGWEAIVYKLQHSFFMEAIVMQLSLFVLKYYLELPR